MHRLRLVCLLIFWGALLVRAQDSAGISGQVVDPSGTPVAEAAITLTNVATHTAAQVTSDANGNYAVMNLPPGTYTIEAWQERFGTLDQTVTIAPKESKSIAFIFKPGDQH